MASLTSNNLRMENVTSFNRSFGSVILDEESPPIATAFSGELSRLLAGIPSGLAEALTSTITGTEGDDSLLGTNGPDTINGLGGDDSLFGRRDDDLLDGGDDNDSLFASGGNDELLGQDGDDLLVGGSGDDILDGGSGNDDLLGGRGSDKFVLRAGDGTDTIFDYRDGTDQFALDGLEFEDLEVVGVTTLTTEIRVAIGGEVLAVLTGVNESAIEATDFVPL